MKAPEFVTIWHDGATTTLKPGDEVGLSFGKIRNRITYYKVTRSYSNCVSLERT